METEVFDKFQAVFRSVMDNEDLAITSQTAADDVEEWDSLTNIQLIVELKKSFGVRFTSVEMSSWNNVGDIISSIVSKLQQK